ncbi:bifunctional adenosylcobinamide kinase/adenosylcobinamide-phosphate guanylyltransferase [Cohnella sp. JJ-181]|uniref:bifunctional adenosylcobinamide kinase/adenosylcobinamide-phosphate guanylyltransferase n=1 Tax=Cohnella rhizoplanae TaxID=2974897 RepID=UPI0022FF8CEA|nr:bifunctional adenosylcobinamide kinase/adenosylcobinamide-phosphate guanylyltransferase [Cohnella sp. JJ-181]CAI6046175.1 hypothetical protein COHCIP112018_01287 [Cohnella sp. JJ-181]
MLLLVTGGTGSGKSAYARRLAESLGREAIAFTCPAWPPRRTGESAGSGLSPSDDRLRRGPAADARGTASGRRGFSWTHVPADGDCAQALHRVNLDSNPYRAERRTLVLDSLSGWLRHRVLERSPDDGTMEETAAAAGELLTALLEFEGILIVVTEEAAAGLVFDPRERTYIRLLAESNQRLAAASHTIYRLSYGMAETVRGERL